MRNSERSSSRCTRQSPQSGWIMQLTMPALTPCCRDGKSEASPVGVKPHVALCLFSRNVNPLTDKITRTPRNCERQRTSVTPPHQQVPGPVRFYIASALPGTVEFLGVEFTMEYPTKIRTRLERTGTTQFMNCFQNRHYGQIYNKLTICCRQEMQTQTVAAGGEGVKCPLFLGRTTFLVFSLKFRS